MPDPPFENIAYLIGNAVQLPVVKGSQLQKAKEGHKILFFDSEEENRFSQKDELGEVKFSAGGGGAIFITDIAPQSSNKSVTQKEYSDRFNYSLSSCQIDTPDLVVSIRAYGGGGEYEPVVTVNNYSCSLSPVNHDSRLFSGSVNIAFGSCCRGCLLVAVAGGDALDPIGDSGVCGGINGVFSGSKTANTARLGNFISAGRR